MSLSLVLFHSYLQCGEQHPHDNLALISVMYLTTQINNKKTKPLTFIVEFKLLHEKHLEVFYIHICVRLHNIKTMRRRGHDKEKKTFKCIIGSSFCHILSRKQETTSGLKKIRSSFKPSCGR